ncbi:MAG: GTP cyclohydrolase I FolE [Puniceicoccales bacterium]|jgi:GTP cyclohydrolase I|nr:GTP cyclohydrolase I FolE [Puniceicoccales bacterium]
MLEFEQFKDALSAILRELGENPGRAGMGKTSQRVVDSLVELLDGYGDSEEELTFFDVPAYDHWIEMHEIPFSSLCEHHLLPFVGKISIAYWPQNGQIIGLSKIVRMLAKFTHRLQLQERMTVELAESIFHRLGSKAVAVRVEGEHFCMSMRGVRQSGIRTITHHRCGAAPHWPF